MSPTELSAVTIFIRDRFYKQTLFHATGSEIALSWSPMRLKILHWRPEFHNWLPHFSIWRLKKNLHSPVGACLKKLISDPVPIRDQRMSSCPGQTYFCLDTTSFWPDKYPLCHLIIKVPPPPLPRVSNKCI